MVQSQIDYYLFLRIRGIVEWNKVRGTSLISSSSFIIFNKTNLDLYPFKLSCKITLVTNVLFNGKMNRVKAVLEF